MSSFKDRVDEYIALHPDDYLGKAQFLSVVRTWNKKMSDNEAYKYYKKKFFDYPVKQLRLKNLLILRG